MYLFLVCDFSFWGIFGQTFDSLTFKICAVSHLKVFLKGGPCDLGVRIWHIHWRDLSSFPGWGTWDPRSCTAWTPQPETKMAFYPEVQLSCSVVSDFCNPMNCSMPGLPVHHQLQEFTQIHVHRVGDAIQPSHPLLSPSPPAPSPSQHQSFPVSQLFAWGGQIIGVSALASFLPKNTQDWSPLEWTGWISLQAKGLSRVFSNTRVQKHQYSALRFLHSLTLTSIHDYWKNHSLD